MPEPSANCLSQRGRTHLTSEPWAQRALGFSSVWDLTRGQHVTVAVVDSGIDYTPQLAGRVSRVDLTGGNGEDCIPHGTDVASIIAASDARARGVPFYGVAPAAHILSIRVQQQEGTSGQTNAQRRKTLADIARGIHYAVVEHAKVINVSIQVSASYPALRAAVEFALRHNVVVVAAAGNDNPGGGQGPFYPASYPGVLSVNAVDQYGQLGGFDVSRTPVSVTAPGVNVASDYPGGFDPSNNGTSFASAFVSGEAALVRAAYPRLTAAQVVHRIIATAAGRTGAHTGAGMINPVQAVTAVLPAQPAASPLPRQVRVPRPRALNSLTRTVALSVTGGALVTAALVAIAAIVVPQGRRRHWRPGPLPQAPLASPAPASAVTSPGPAAALATPTPATPAPTPAPSTAGGGAPEANPVADRTPRQDHPLPPAAKRPAEAGTRRRLAWPSRGARQLPASAATARPDPAVDPAVDPTAGDRPANGQLSAPPSQPPATPEPPAPSAPPPAREPLPALITPLMPAPPAPTAPEPPLASTSSPAADQPAADELSPVEPGQPSASLQPPSATPPATASRPPSARHRRRRK
jgi:type VII secretion-associated serine protease mycosin